MIDVDTLCVNDEQHEEEKEDLKKQIICLKHQLFEKDRKIKELESQLTNNLKKSSSVDSTTKVITSII